MPRRGNRTTPKVRRRTQRSPGPKSPTTRRLGRALTDAGAPDGTLGHIQGTAVSVTALRDRRIKACGFTGSVSGGRALFDFASARPDPIPFYGELGSINPVYVTAAAAGRRGAQIGQEFAAA